MLQSLKRNTKLIVGMTVLLFASFGAQANLVTNGGFETGNFSGWSLTGNVGFGTGVCQTGATFLGSTCSSHSGSYAAVSGPSPTSGFISQTLATQAGASYVVEFFLRNDNLGGTPSNYLNVIFDGLVVHAIVNDTQHDFVQIGLSGLTATSASTVLEFELVNNPGGFYIDDVRVNLSVPEPGTLALLGLGFASLAAARRRKR